jgi:hypothetical protein
MFWGSRRFASKYNKGTNTNRVRKIRNLFFFFWNFDMSTIASSSSSSSSTTTTKTKTTPDDVGLQFDSNVSSVSNNAITLTTTQNDSFLPPHCLNNIKKLIQSKSWDVNALFVRFEKTKISLEKIFL